MKELGSYINHLDVSADWVGLREVRESKTYRFIRDLNPQSNTRVDSHGIMIEVLDNGQFGYSATNDLSLSGINKAAKQALENSKSAANNSLFKFSPDVRPKAIGSYESPYVKDVSALSAGEINEILVKSNKFLRSSDKVISATSMAMIVETEFNYVCTNGSNANQKFIILITDQAVNVKDGDVIQRRSMGRMGHQMGLEALNEDLVMSNCEKILSEAIDLLRAEECPNEKMDIIIAPSQMVLQIHESIGHALEIDRILGDERNYAGWSFVRLNDFGNLKYGSDIMNITFDPTIPNEMASYLFDDGGMEAKKEYLIKDGLLIRGLGGMESQARSKTPAVANFRACSWNRAPIDRMANLNLEPGNSSFEDMVSSVEKGVYVETNRSWSIDDYRNKFQFGMEYGKLIENGKLTKTVRNPNYRAVTTPFWNKLKMVGDKSTFEVFGTPNCGKGEPNQVIRVGHATPACLFENIEVFGGA
ncbi:MAG: Zn-dependent protease [Pelagibacteraceae bacterium TMED237]|nr:Zn-dependent protease [Candidatus Neomarinimicrobiota bacterium]OUW95592.1 MAG: Zn-dependent protease [Pelagibacteraceae bacterium TMED237]|tara:strand:+ start:2699 stop:4123 length:1425 start_codon:yes stop_codon:yes gene_type:complete